MATTEPTTDLDDIAPEQESVLASNEYVAESFHEYMVGQWKKIRSGDSGLLPVLVGFVVIILIFQTQDSKFLSAGNLVNLLDQSAVLIVFGMAEIYILLLGEIDLSIGFNAGVGGAITAELAAPPHNVNWLLAVLAGVAVCAFFGGVQGLIITRLGLPAFIVTLAGYLGLQGLLLYIFNQDKHSVGGTIAVTNNVLSGIVYNSMSPAAGWIVMIAVVAVYAVYSLLIYRRRIAKELAAPPFTLVLIKIAAIAAGGIVLVLICNQNRSLSAITTLKGVPYVVLVVLGVLAIYTLLLDRTKFGRYVYAIGGNPEAARRAGIKVNGVRLTCFIMAGFTAGIAGIILNSFLGSAQSGIAGGTYVLYAVAAAVIGGTSLFGGRGRMVHALIGGLIIASIANGMFLIGLSTAAQEMVNALVLLAAVMVDALARRRGPAVR